MMAREIPYFKFFTGEYLTGDITLCSLTTQGVFINLCCFYWNKQGHYLVENVIIRFSNNDKEITELIDKNIIKIDGDVIRIDFLDAQLKERAMLHKNRVEAGRKGGKIKKLQANGVFCLSKQLSKAKPIRKEKIRKEKIREEYIVREFDKFWDLYDMRKARADCEAYWNGDKPLKTKKYITDEEREICIKKLPAYVNNTNKDGTYPTRKDPKTYLYNSSWNDEIITKQDTSGKPVEAV